MIYMAYSEALISGSKKEMIVGASASTSGKLTRKYSGAANYKSKFKLVWKKQYPFITEVRNDKHHFYCTICR